RGQGRGPSLVVDLRCRVQGVDGGRQRQARATQETADRGLLAGPTHRIQETARFPSPGFDDRAGLLRREGHVEHRPFSIPEEVWTGQSARVEEIHLLGVRFWRRGEYTMTGAPPSRSVALRVGVHALREER